ncbi:unnamed protein product [Parnassius apollo]|uniref:(apollo) hypothetical protein n=1 Tax=Parnassius apollo TaxID=110799 RepID=A0A8S3WA26_PARAO|nr:unnamed protein product [Parnassius apollo]
MPKVKGKSLTRNHFEKLNNDSAKCQLCGKIIKVGGGTSNMLAHLKRSHPQATVPVNPDLTVKESLQLALVEQVIKKCKAIVNFFKKSSVGWRALKSE